MEWRVVRHSIASAPHQMAIDDALLEVYNNQIESGEKPKPIVRTYQFNKGSIILGHRQNSDMFDFGKLNGYDLTTRMTGGGHMYFSPDDIHFSVIFPRRYMPDNIIEGFRFFNGKVIEALRENGYSAHLGRTSIKVDKGGKKTIMGSAQRRMGNSVFMHAGLIVNNYTSELFSMLGTPPEQREAWNKHILTLSSIKEKVDISSLRKSIIERFAGSDYPSGYLTEEEEALARKKMEEIYSNPEKVRSGTKDKSYLCILEGLMTEDYEKHLLEHARGKI